MIKLLLTLFLVSCVVATPEVDSERRNYKAGECAAWDVKAVEDTGQTCDPNTEISIWGATKSTNPKLDDTYQISYIIRDSGQRVTISIGVTKLNSLTYPVVCGSCCPPGKTCAKGCTRK